MRIKKYQERSDDRSRRINIQWTRILPFDPKQTPITVSNAFYHESRSSNQDHIQIIDTISATELRSTLSLAYHDITQPGLNLLCHNG